MSMSSPPGGSAQRIVLPGVKQTIAVASGKGGVGKSTVAANLALALRMQGHQVGLMDADIYGPSVPIMMGLGMIDQKTTQFPMEKYGLKLVSMGFVVGPDQATIWRGPMVHKAITQFLTGIPWGELDLPGHRHASRYWRRTAHADADRPTERGRRGHHTAGCQPDRCPQGVNDVPAGPSTGPGNRGKHELLHLPPLRRKA